MRPEIGKIVIFKGLPSNGTETHPAIITRVLPNNVVNLTVILDRNAPTSIRDIKYNPNTGEEGWSWPKYPNIFVRLWRRIIDIRIYITTQKPIIISKNTKSLDRPKDTYELADEIVKHIY